MAGRTTDVSAAYGAVAVTPSDSSVIPPTRGLFIGVTGNVVVRHVNGDIATYSNVAVGVLPVQVNRVYSTSTTATTMLALY